MADIDNVKNFEKKWREEWQKNHIYKTTEGGDKPKYYVLDMFPYPSGVGLHVGHPKGYIATDCICRKKLLQGFNVLHPMGWDAFGLPAENYALKNNLHPKISTDKNVAVFKEQLESLGFTYDWDREINTTDPDFYKWTQWAFIQMYNHYFDKEENKAKPISELKMPEGLTEKEKQKFIDEHRLATVDNKPINWCPSCKTGLANEDLEEGKCERCGGDIERKPMRQWIIKITEYAERLLQGIEELPDWVESIREMQKNWIGKSIGTEFKMMIEAKGKKVIILDGLGGDGTSNWIPWLKSYLEDKGNTVYNPCLKNYNNPSIDEQLSQLIDEYADMVDENTIIVGHSLGAVLGQNFLCKLGKNIDKLVMVGPAFGEMNVDEMAEKYSFIMDAKDNLKDYLSRPIDFQKVEQLTNSICVILSNDDPYINFVQAKECFLLKYKNSEIVTFKNKGHFNTEKTKEFTELIQYIDNSFYVFTTRVDTVYGMSFVAIAPEHPLLQSIVTEECKDSVTDYIEQAKKKTDLQRTELQKDKTGVFSGAYAINPFNGKEVPIYVADYVLLDYGTGVVMAVPAHDERDFEFAVKYDLPIIQSVAPYIVCTGDAGPKSNESIVKFDCATTIIKHYSENKYLVLKFRNGAYGLVGGSVEKGETKEETILREVREETGYTDVYIEEVLFDTAYGRGYKSWKDREELGEDRVYVVKLRSEHQVEISEQEKSKHDIVWLDEKDVANTITWDHHLYYWNHYLKSNRTNTEYGIVINSGEFTGMSSDSAKQEMNQWLENKCLGYGKINYKIQDWVFSRQRYWGEPIPMIFCPDCGVVPMDESDLPLKLPEVENYEPTGTEEGPLAKIDEWINVKCPKCGADAKRESNTMPQWAGSSWYWLRYMDPKNDNKLVDPEVEKYWGQVDVYVGGAEHATRHLIYARFWHKFLYDIGVVSTNEPFKKLQSVGLILAEDGRKMSKRWGNVINPDDVIKEYGTDAMRVYEMFMGPFNQETAWNTNGVKGVRKFLDRVYNMKQFIESGYQDSNKILSLLHATIKKITYDIDEFKFNTSVSQMMIFVNEVYIEGKISHFSFEKFILILSPFAPHLAEELWSIIGNKFSIFTTGKRPEYDESLIQTGKVNVAVQFNGKVRGALEVDKDISETDMVELVKSDPKLGKYFEGNYIKTIFVPGKIINLILK